MLVLPREGDATLVVPRLEAPRVVERPDVFGLRALGRDRRPGRRSSPSAAGAAARRRHRRPDVGPLPRRPPGARCRRPRSGAADRRHSARSGRSRTRPRSTALRRGRRPPPTGSWPRSSRPATSRWSAGPRPRCRPTFAPRLLAEGHHRVNFAIVAAGANAASPHHEPGDRVIEAGEVVLCDFGGTVLDGDGVGYCSDITRCVHLGEPPAEFADAVRRAASTPRPGGRGRGRRARRARTSTRRPAGSSPTAATATSSSTAPVTASASRSTRTPTSWPATARRSLRATPSRRARDLRARPVGRSGSRTSWWPPPTAPRPSTRSPMT